MATKDNLTKKELEELEKERELFLKKVKYYIQEFAILFITFAGVIISDALSKRAAGQLATINDVFLDWFNLILSSMAALICYGTLFTKFKFNDSVKPPMIKRLITGLMTGIAWRTAIGWAN